MVYLKTLSIGKIMYCRWN